MNPRQVLAFFESCRQASEPLVLVTVFETGGSTYSKAGDYMLVNGEGDFCGMLSGGCLEGDLAERAKLVLDGAVPEIAEYDLSADDELFGLGVGCEGRMRIFLQPLSPDNGYEPLASIVRNGDRGNDVRVGIVVESSDAAVAPGTSFVESTKVDLSVAGLGTQSINGVDCEVLTFVAPRLPRLLVLGAGMDAEPLVRLASELGWHCVVQDHRPAYIESREFPDNVQRICTPATDLTGTVDLTGFDLAMVMSHHLASDTEYLKQLAETEIGYIGLLGPPHRRDRILQSIPEIAARLDGRLSGPAGIDVGGRGPGPIALSIIAEMQQHLSQSRH